MENRPQITALIPARGGSIGVPKKNIRTLGGLPLIVWAIEVAKRTPGISNVVVTTDSDEIAQVAKDAGAQIILRPSAIATSQSLVIDAVRHAYDALKNSSEAPESMVLLEPTCPFRSVDDITRCLALISPEGGYDSAATFCEARLNPNRAWKIVADKPSPYFDSATSWKPRQDLAPAYQLNGGVYAFRCPHIFESAAGGFLFGNVGAVLMPSERSFDIDSEFDFLVAEAWLGRK